MEPTAITCAGTNCDRYGGRLVRGMCISHYNAWRAVSPDKRKCKPRPKQVGCTISGCFVSQVQGRGLCTKHYSRWRKHGDPLWEPAPRPAACAAVECERSHYGLGYCSMHYDRVKKYGDPEANPKISRTPICDVDGCEKPSPHKKYCQMHEYRIKQYGTPSGRERTRHVHSEGYVVVKSEGHQLAQESGWVYEHRVVLFDTIGPGEHACHWCGTPVHWERSYPQHRDALVVDHVNEVKDDNSPANLVASCAPCNVRRSSPRAKRQGSNRAGVSL